MVSRLPDKLIEESVGRSLREWKTFMLNDVRMLPKLVRPFCVLRRSAFFLSSSRNQSLHSFDLGTGALECNGLVAPLIPILWLPTVVRRIV